MLRACGPNPRGVPRWGAEAVRPVRTRMNIGPNACSRPVRQPLERVRDPLAKGQAFGNAPLHGYNRPRDEKRQRTAAVQNLADFAKRLGVRQSSAALAIGQACALQL